MLGQKFFKNSLQLQLSLTSLKKLKYKVRVNKNVQKTVQNVSKRLYKMFQWTANANINISIKHNIKYLQFIENKFSSKFTFALHVKFCKYLHERAYISYFIVLSWF